MSITLKFLGKRTPYNDVYQYLVNINLKGHKIMDKEQQSLILDSAVHIIYPQGVRLSYGTSGFRGEASLLKSTVYRAGILAALRALKTQSTVGLMITASHNKVSDNGVKIADPSGGMMSQDWEPFADIMANASDHHEFLQLLMNFVNKERIQFEKSKPVLILLARDTRPSGESLMEAAKQGINSISGAVFNDIGVLTTPQLHWMVRSRNKGLMATELDYCKQLSSSFKCLIDLIPKTATVNVHGELLVDGANGVGAQKLKELMKMLTDLVIEVRNCGDDGVLNEEVGADFVQKEKVIPRGFDASDVGKRCASLDGDADRLVYFTLTSETERKVTLVDGDKILSLFALFVREQLNTLKESCGKKINNYCDARLGAIQTAYANGASTSYLKQLGLDVVLTPTGVKFLHEKALEYDIGIYFEANGHGTILFSEHFLHRLEARKVELTEGSEEYKAVLRLLAVHKLINQAVGDALSGLLLVEVILRYMGWSIHDWSELYHDLPSRQLKVEVLDRTIVVTENAETRVVKPSGIQQAIDTETAKYPEGRCFIRPSGTEDVIRVYAEACTQESVDCLAKSVAQIVDQFLGSGQSTV